MIDLKNGGDRFGDGLILFATATAHTHSADALTIGLERDTPREDDRPAIDGVGDAMELSAGLRVLSQFPGFTPARDAREGLVDRVVDAADLRDA